MYESQIKITKELNNDVNSCERHYCEEESISIWMIKSKWWRRFAESIQLCNMLYPYLAHQDNSLCLQSSISLCQVIHSYFVVDFYTQFVHKHKCKCLCIIPPRHSPLPIFQDKQYLSNFYTLWITHILTICTGIIGYTWVIVFVNDLMFVTSNTDFFLNFTHFFANYLDYTNIYAVV